MIKNRTLFSQTLPNHRFSPPFIIVSEVESTNNYAMAKLQSGLVVNGTCILAIMQTKGKGQRGKQWLSDPGSNITMSTVIKATESGYQHFLLSASAALACMDLLREVGISTPKIKWPNDIYVNDRKAGGILIETLMRGTQMLYSVVGTGVNVNQSNFPQVGQPVTSLKIETQTAWDPVDLGRKLHSNLLGRTTRSPVKDIMEEYNTYLFKAGEEIKLRKENMVFNTMIKEVNARGELVCFDRIERRFAVGEVAFV